MSRLPGKGLVSTQEAAWLNWLTWMLDSGDRVGWFPASLQSDFGLCQLSVVVLQTFGGEAEIPSDGWLGSFPAGNGAAASRVRVAKATHPPQSTLALVCNGNTCRRCWDGRCTGLNP